MEERTTGPPGRRRNKKLREELTHWLYDVLDFELLDEIHLNPALLHQGGQPDQWHIVSHAPVAGVDVRFRLHFDSDATWLRLYASIPHPDADEVDTTLPEYNCWQDRSPPYLALSPNPKDRRDNDETLDRRLCDLEDDVDRYAADAERWFAQNKPAEDDTAGETTLPPDWPPG